MKNTVKLKWNRKRLGMTQKAFAEHVGLSVQTISRLELDETAWATLKTETVDKIQSLYDSMASWQPERPDKVLEAINSEDMDTIDEDDVRPAPVVVCEAVIKNEGLSTNDKKTLTMLQFLYDELNEVTTHCDFVHTMKLINKIVRNY